jgi:hypothetical protein
MESKFYQILIMDEFKRLTVSTRDDRYTDNTGEPPYIKNPGGHILIKSNGLWQKANNVLDDFEEKVLVKSETGEEIIEKGRRGLPIGTRKMWNGVEFEKRIGGWFPVKEPRGPKQQEDGQKRQKKTEEMRPGKTSRREEYGFSNVMSKDLRDFAKVTSGDKLKQYAKASDESVSMDGVKISEIVRDEMKKRQEFLDNPGKAHENDLKAYAKMGDKSLRDAAQKELEARKPKKEEGQGKKEGSSEDESKKKVDENLETAFDNWFNETDPSKKQKFYDEYISLLESENIQFQEDSKHLKDELTEDELLDLTDDQIAERLEFLQSKLDNSISEKEKEKWDDLWDGISRLHEDNQFAKDVGWDKKQLKSMRFYRASGYIPINKSLYAGGIENIEENTIKEWRLRYGQDIINNINDIVNTIKSSMDKLPKYEGELFRGSKIHGNKDIFIKDHDRGNIVEIPAFLSSSDSEKEADGFMTKDGSGYMYNIKSKNARDLRIFNISERELLFKTNTQFLITKAPETRQDSIGREYFYIEVEEI